MNYMNILNIYLKKYIHIYIYTYIYIHTYIYIYIYICVYTYIVLICIMEETKTRDEEVYKLFGRVSRRHVLPRGETYK